MGKQWKQWETIFLGSKITADGDCSHEIKRCLHVGRKAMTSLLRFSSVTQLCPTLQPHESQHTRPPCPSPTPGVHSDSHPSSPWCHLAISSSVIPFSSCPPSLPASESFPMSIQGWFPLWLTGLILQSKGLSKVFSNTTVQKHRFFGAQLSL